MVGEDDGNWDKCGTQHNVVPDSAALWWMSGQWLLGMRNSLISFRGKGYKANCELKQGALKLIINTHGHPLVRRGIELGLTAFGSPTTSDQAVMPFNTVKIGPGDSARSHTANEYILLSGNRRDRNL